MSEIDRDSFLESLERLLSEDDQEVLAAARTIKGQMGDAGVTWDMLLVQAPGEDDHDAYGEHDDLEDQDAEAPQAVRAPGDALGLIEELLSKYEIAPETREELGDYKQDIADGEFTESDHRYLQSLYQRVTGRKR